MATEKYLVKSLASIISETNGISLQDTLELMLDSDLIQKDKEAHVVHPQDGKLEAFIRPLTKSGWWGYKYEDPSIFPFEEMTITGKEAFAVEADGKMSKEVKVKIKLAHSKVEMIVGRVRRF